jgi:peroxiredoxin
VRHVGPRPRRGAWRSGRRRAGVTALACGVAFAGLAATAGEPWEALGLTRLGATEPAAAFTVTTPDGSWLSLQDLRGKVVLLNFWATWCEPCREEMPAMERLARTYRERGLAVLAVSMDRDGASIVRPFLKRHDLTFLVGLDPEQTVARLYRVWALPSTIIVGRQGIPLFAVQGARGLGQLGRSPALRRAVEVGPATLAQAPRS